jgi:hypothetical protein
MNCEQAADARQCRVAQPKEWSADERARLEQTIGRLAEDELVRGIIAGARDNGYQGLRRYFTDTKLDQASGWVPKFSPGFVLYGSKTIGLTDAYFQIDDLRDPLADYRVGDLVLLHELIHAYDDRGSSAGAAFTSITGWVLKNDKWEYANRVNLSEYFGVYAETLTLYARGRHAEAWARDRRFATSLRFPVPTIQSLATPGESFADILAHLIVDPRARDYLEPRVVAWFEANVFPALRDKARRGWF